MVLKDELTEDRVVALADDLGWELLSDVTDQDGIDRDIVWHVGQRVLFEYLVEHHVGCAVAIVRGHPEKGVRRIAAAVEPVLNPWSIKDLIDAADKASDPAERAAAITRLGMGAPRDFCPRKIYKRIKTALLDAPARDVRLAALRAAQYTGWPKFIPLLQQVADEEDPGVVQMHAAVILASSGHR